jgi:hypothetical protein
MYRALLTVVASLALASLGYVGVASECLCTPCCREEYCECFCQGILRNCTNYEYPQGRADMLSFLTQNCKAGPLEDEEELIRHWDCEVINCFCADFYGPDCAGPPVLLQDGDCGDRIQDLGLTEWYVCGGGG